MLLMMCRETIEGGSQGSATYCSLEDQEDGPPNVRETATVH